MQDKKRSTFGNFTGSDGKYRYLISCDRYRIVYQIEGQTVFVDDIQDCRQSDLNNLL